MLFRSSSKEPTMIRLPNGFEYARFDESLCTEVKRMIVERPMFLQTDVPHRVSNPTLQPRVMLLIRLKSHYPFSV